MPLDGNEAAPIYAGINKPHGSNPVIKPIPSGKFLEHVILGKTVLIFLDTINLINCRDTNAIVTHKIKSENLFHIIFLTVKAPIIVSVKTINKYESNLLK